MLDRDGDIVTRFVKSRDKIAMKGVILSIVLPGTTIHTDEFGGYKDIDQSGFNHVKVNHSIGEYARKDGASVNGIEGFWAQLKRSINGTHIHVTAKHLSKYLCEFEFRYNLRKHPGLMFPCLLASL